MKKFVTTKYQIESEKINVPFTVVMISDLHNVVFGEKNRRLLEEIRRLKPDLLAVAGDLVLGKPGASLREPEEFLREGLKIAPVFYAPAGKVLCREKGAGTRPIVEIARLSRPWPQVCCVFCSKR